MPPAHRAPVRPKGKHGILVEVTPARVYNQFSNIAMASLVYDFVAAEWIRGQSDYHVDGLDIPGLIADTSKQFLDLGLCVDPYDIEPISPMPGSEVDFRKKFTSASEEQMDHYFKFGTIYHAAHRMVEKKKKKAKTKELLNELDDAIRLTQEIEKSHHRFLFKLSIKEHGYVIDDGAYLDKGINEKFNPIVRETLGKGHIPLLGCCSSTTEVIRQGEIAKVLQLFIRDVPFPAEMPADEFVEFRNSRIVKRSIGKFREIAGALIGEQAPAQYVIDELMEQYEAYKSETERLKSKTRVATLKFLISTAAGTFEDILKLRLESLSKRPFEIGEWFVKKQYAERTQEISPFAFAVEMDIGLK